MRRRGSVLIRTIYCGSQALCSSDSRAFQRLLQNLYGQTRMIEKEWCNKYRNKLRAVSLGVPFGVHSHSCLLVDCELWTEIGFGFAFKAVSLLEVFSYKDSVSVSLLNLVSSLSKYKWLQPLETAPYRRWLASFPSGIALQTESSKCIETSGIVTEDSWLRLSIIILLNIHLVPNFIGQTLNYRIAEFLRLEKTFKVTKSSHQPTPLNHVLKC